MIDKLLKNSRLLIILFFVFSTALILLVTLGQKNTKSSTGGEYSPTNDVAYFVDSTNLYKALGGRRFNYLQLDLRAHFNDIVKGYNKPVNFSVASVITNDKTITIEGKYQDKVGNTKIEVKLLNNERIDVVMVTGKKSNRDILPSNSKINRYISTLPITGPDYTIDFLLSDNTIVISIYDRDPAIAERAKATIVQAVGKEQVDKQQITVSFPSNLDTIQPDSGVADQGYR